MNLSDIQTFTNELLEYAREQAAIQFLKSYYPPNAAYLRYEVGTYADWAIEVYDDQHNELQPDIRAPGFRAIRAQYFHSFDVERDEAVRNDKVILSLQDFLDELINIYIIDELGVPPNRSVNIWGDGDHSPLVIEVYQLLKEHNV